MRDILLAILGSGAFYTLLQYLLTRWDRSKNIDRKIDALADRIEETQAINARTAILRFSDELKSGMPHSLEYFRQILDDIDIYEGFCLSHPNFKNSYTVIATEHIKETYEELMKKGKI